MEVGDWVDGGNSLSLDILAASVPVVAAGERLNWERGTSISWKECWKWVVKMEDPVGVDSRENRL